MTRRRKRALVWSAVVLGVLLLWCTVVAIAVADAGAPNEGATADAAIVLGAAVWDDEPSPVFQARLDHAVKLYRSGRVQRIIVTGGRSEEDTLSEGEAGRQYIAAQGVPDEVILAESRSRNTGQNLANAKSLMTEVGLSSAVIVSDPYHLLRAGMHAGRIGLDHELSPTQTTRFTGFSSKARQLAREVYYVTQLLVTGR